MLLGLFVSAAGYDVSTPPQLGFNPLSLVMISAVLSYFIFMEGFFGTTPGKTIFKLRVLSEDGTRCRIVPAIIRNLLRIIDGLFFYLVGAILVARSEKKQRLGDRVAKTIVAKRRHECAYLPPPPATSSSIKYCMSCGASIAIQAMFCPRCGARQ
jgi:uncharacterized RDD family membrane protein YckC